MHLNARPPIFVPAEYRAEIERMSKAALMDLVWDFATTSAADESMGAVMVALRERRDIVLQHRKQESRRG